MQFKLAQIQVAIFLSSMDIRSRLRIATLASEEIPGASDVDPILIPLEDDAPPALPQIQIVNESTGWTFQFAPLRCDFFYSPPDSLEYEKLSDVVLEVEKPVVSLWNRLESELGARGHRLGSVFNFSDNIENAAEVLRREYFNTKYGENSKETQIHYLQIKETASFALNHWTRLKSRERKQDISEALLLIIDVNTVPGRRIQVGTEKIREFLEVSRQITFETVALHAEDK